jgi:hypothetical protein
VLAHGYEWIYEKRQRAELLQGCL